MTPYILTTLSDPKGILKTPAKKVKNVFSTEVILTIQTMKRLAAQWEQEHRQRCEGLAANQIGSLLRIAIVRKTPLIAPFKPLPRAVASTAGVEVDKPDTIAKYLAEDFDLADKHRAEVDHYDEWHRRFGSTFDPWATLINPVILEQSGVQKSTEGCLSLPGQTFTVNRPKVVVFKYTNEKNQVVGPQRLDKYSTPALCHELDHLDGILLDRKEAGI